MRMGYRILRRTKTLFLTFGLFSLGLYLVLNTLAEEFSAESADSLMKHPRDLRRSIEKSKVLNEFQASFVAQGRRKPKTMNMGNEDHTDDNVVYERENKVSDDDDYNKLKFQPKDNVIQSKTAKLLREQEIQKNKAENVLNKDYVKYINTQHEQNYNSNDEDDNDDDYDEDDEDDDDNYHYDDATNPPFKPGDFGDIRGFEYYRKPKLKYAEVESVVFNKNLKEMRDEAQHLDTDNANDGVEESRKDLTENGIFWSQYVESLIPRGLSYANVTKLLKNLRGQVVQTLEKPSWDKCGRPQNGFAKLSDGTQMCARYRQPHSSFVYGEALSFYLSRLLQMDNVPAVILARTNITSPIWRDVNISSLAWKENKVVALIQWIENINSGASSKVRIPPIILEAYRKGTTVTSHVIQTSSLIDRNPAHIAEVVQWGTMIVFDYLTGNYDRVASMQDAEDKEKDPKIIEESIRNLRKSSQNGKLWLIDNESGLFDAYELLEPYHTNSRFTTFHNKMLRTMCVFQSPLVKSLRKLSEQLSPHKRLLNFARSFEPLVNELPKDNRYKQFVETFDKRLVQVMEWIRHCQLLDAG